MAEEKENLSVEEKGIEFGSDKKVAENSEFELIDEGTYEVVLEKLEQKTSTKNGKTTKYMNVTFTIRDDVDQDFKKRKIWYTIFARDNDVAFNFNAINAIIITQEGRKDYKRHFKNVDEIFQYLIGLHLRLDIGIEFNQFKGKDDNIIVDGSFQFSQWDIDHPETGDNLKSVGTDGAKGANLEAVDLPDDDLPF